MRILFTCVEYGTMTGSPQYVYELTRELAKLGHEVAIVSILEPKDPRFPLLEMTEKNGVKVYDIRKFQRTSFVPDVLHVQQPESSKLILMAYPNTPAVATIHSELTPVEAPLQAPNLKKYIAIRPAIKDRIMRDLPGVGKKQIEVIYNPVDFSRFNMDGVEQAYTNTNEPPNVLFVGSVDYLRRNPIFDLVRQALDGKINLFIVGDKAQNYLDFDLPKNIHWHEADAKVEEYIKSCDKTAGIMLGRTTLEGFACGKPGIVYEINPETEIVSVTEMPVPKDLSFFDSRSVAKQVEKLYQSIL